MKLLLVDGHSLAYRAFFAMPPLSNSRGESTQAVLAVANMTFKIINDEKPTHMVVFFDREVPQFRLQAYEAYKANRPKAPDDFLSQLPRIKEFFSALGIAVVEEPGFEADDWIAAVAKQAEEHNFQTVILSGDLDLLQLVSEKTSVLISKRGITHLVRYDVEEVKKRYSLTPSQLIDLKALAGDPSDNIRGIPGIGEKSAIKLLQAWGNLENLFQNKDQVPPKIRTLLEGSQDLARLNRELVSLRHDAPFEFFPDRHCLAYDLNKLREFLERMEFKNLISRLGLDVKQTFEPLEFRMADSEAALSELLQKFKQTGTAGLLLWPFPSPFLEQHFLGIHFPDSPPWVVAPNLLDSALRQLAGISSPKEIFAYNWKAFLLAFRNIRIATPLWDVLDVQIAGWLCNSLRTNPSIPELAQEHLKISLPQKLEEVPALAAHWSGVLCPLGEDLKVKLQAFHVERLYHDIEFPVISVLADMEWEGVRVDLPYLQLLSEEFSQELKQLEGEIYRESGMIFNINSPKQLAEVLYGKLNLPKGKKTKTSFSTDVEELERLAASSPLAKMLLTFREIAKLKNTYVDVFPQIANPEKERVHTTYLQTGTATGRLSSKEPNLQNIPIRTPYGRKIRKAFIAGKPGWKILSADYSQIELRLLAHFSKDPVLHDAFMSHEDIHSRTAAEIFNVSRDQVTPEMRRMAKVVNFGIIYGMTEHGLSQTLGMTKEEARNYITRYLDRFPKVGAYIQASLEEARQTGLTKTLFGRLRPVPELQSPKSYIRQQAERIGINAPLQGTVADLMKIAMIRIQKKLKEKQYNALMVMQVHDELVFEVSEDHKDEVAAMVKHEMENVTPLDPPLCVDLGIGENWADLEKL